MVIAAPATHTVTVTVACSTHQSLALLKNERLRYGEFKLQSAMYNSAHTHNPTHTQNIGNQSERTKYEQ